MVVENRGKLAATNKSRNGGRTFRQLRYNLRIQEFQTLYECAPGRAFFFRQSDRLPIKTSIGIPPAFPGLSVRFFAVFLPQRMNHATYDRSHARPPAG